MQRPEYKPYALVFGGVLVFSLLASITNAVPLSVSFVVLALVVPYALTRVRNIPGVLVALAMLYAYFLLSTLVYAPGSLLAPSFYRRDGNFFVTFLPMLLGGLSIVRIDVGRVVKIFLVWATGVNIAFMAVYMVTGATIIYAEPGIYHFLFEAHNAAGGYLSMLAALWLGFLLVEPAKFWPAVGVLVNSVALIMTVSRGSMIGLVLAVILMVVLGGRFKRTAIFGLVVVIAAVLAFAYPLWLDAGKPASITGGNDLNENQIAQLDANIGDRLLFLWPRAFDLFLQSPVFGTGYGSFNDTPYSMAGIPHVFAWNNNPNIVFDSGHAHNTYLHVLAECGLLGLALLIFFLKRLWKAIQLFQPQIRVGLGIAFWVALFSSETEHRLFTPAQMLPFTIIAGLALANQRWELRYGERRALPDGDLQ